jgi:transcriptional regulator NrdR family protein
MVDIVKRVIKRDGRIVKFDDNKITDAVIRTMKSVEAENDELAKAVTNEIVKKINGKEEIPVEDIQDLVEDELIKRTDPIISKAFYIVLNVLRFVKLKVF